MLAWMSVMDCQTFDSSLIDALYDELDAETSAAMDEHGAGCDRCSVRAARLRKTRELVRPGLVELPLPDGLEARILAATEAAMDSAGAPVVRASERKTGGAKILAFVSRPQFAIAATFLLVLGAAAVVVNPAKRGATSEPAMAPERAAGPAASAAPAAMADSVDEPAPVATATAVAVATAAASGMAGALALAPPPAPAAAPRAAQGRPYTTDRGDPWNEPSPSKAGGGGAVADSKPSGRTSTGANDPAFVAAKELYDAGRYAEALPKFEALAGGSPEAELYAARCLANTHGCAAAAPRYESAARRTAGTESGNRVALEAQRCLEPSKVKAAAPAATATPPRADTLK